MRRQLDRLVEVAVGLGEVMPRRARRALREELRSGRRPEDLEREIRCGVEAAARQRQERTELAARWEAERAEDDAARERARESEAAHRREHPPSDPALRPLLRELGPSVQAALCKRGGVPGSWQRNAAAWIIGRVEPLALAPDGRLTLWVPRPGSQEPFLREVLDQEALRLPGVSRVVLLFAPEPGEEANAGRLAEGA